MPTYYGWYIVGISMFVLMLVIGTTINAFGLFVLPVSADFKLSRANTNTGLILLNFGMALAAPFVGRLLDHVSIRRIMAVSAILLGASFVTLGLSHNIWLSAFVLALPLSIAVVGSGTLTSTTLVARWFAIHRGRAMAISAIGFSLGALVMVPLIGLLVAAVGWRQSLIVMGCALAAMLLLMVPFVRERPGPNDKESRDPVASGQVPHTQATPMRVGQLLRQPPFWTIALSTALGFGVLQTIVVSLVPLAQESGFSIAEAANLLSIFGGMAIVGKLVLAWLGDRLDRLRVLAALFGLVALTSSTMLIGDTYLALIVCSAFLGLVAGATTPVFTALIADRFGAASFGTAFGAASLIIALSGAACVRFGGEVFDRTGNYDLMFLSFLLVSGASAALMLATEPLSRLVGGKGRAQ